MAAIAVVEVFLAFGRRILLTLVSTGLETNMRDDLYAQLQRLDVGFHDRWQSGQLLSRAMTDLSVIRRFVGFGAIFFILIVVQVLAIFGVLLALHPSLALLTFAATIPVLILCHRFELRYMAVVRRIQDQTGDLTTTIEEGAKGIRVLKAFGRGDVAFAGYQAEAQTIHDTQMERITLHTRFVWVLALIPNLTLTLVLLAGVLAVGSGGLTLGGLVAFVSYVLMLTFPLEILAWIMALAGEAESAAVRIYEVFDTVPTIQDRPGAATLGDDVRGDIRFEGVSFTYEGSERTVLSDIDLTVAAGEIVAVVGATGSGKTTLVTLLTRLYDPTVGRITLDGHDLRDLTVTSLRRHVGFAFEEPSLFSASVRENLLMGKPDATEAEVLARPGGGAGRLRPRPPVGPRHPHRRAGPLPLRRPAPAPRAGPRHHRTAARPGARRPALRGRRPHRGGRPGRAAARARGVHRVHRRAPPVDGGAGAALDPPRRGPPRGRRHPPRPARLRAPLPRRALRGRGGGGGLRA